MPLFSRIGDRNLLLTTNRLIQHHFLRAAFEELQVDTEKTMQKLSQIIQTLGQWYFWACLYAMS